MRYEHGQWNATCDRCGGRYKARQIRKEWDGLRVCCGAGTRNCWERKHPQELVKGKPDRQSPPWVRPATGPDDSPEITNDWGDF